MVDASRTPVIVATGQVVERDAIVSAAELAVHAARQALDAAGGVARRVQRVTMLSTLFSAASATVASEVAVSARAARRVPRDDVGRRQHAAVAGHARRGGHRARRARRALIVGAEAARSERAAGTGAGGVRFRANAGDATDGDADPVVGGSEKGYVSRAEVKAGLTYPTVVYPLLESVLAARAGRSFAEQRAYVAELMARFTEVAAAHPCAWFRTRATAEELATPTPDNRLISDPYTKRMNAFPFVDQAAALVMCSLAVAQDAGVDDGAIFVWSGADAYEVRLPTARPDLGRAAGLHAAVARTFAAGASAPTT